MARAEFESWPKPAVSHDHTLLGQVVDEAKSAVTADGMDLIHLLILRLILRCMLHEQDLES